MRIGGCCWSGWGGSSTLRISRALPGLSDAAEAASRAQTVMEALASAALTSLRELSLESEPDEFEGTEEGLAS